jgi:hypothetical protein
LNEGLKKLKEELKMNLEKKFEDLLAWESNFCEPLPEMDFLAVLLDSGQNLKAELLIAGIRPNPKVEG